jgi:DNA-nicking Smr family endonuclease
MKRPQSKRPSRMAAAPARNPDAPGSLSGGETALWRHVATSIQPLKAKSRVRRHGITIDAAHEPDLTVPERRPARAKATSAPAPPPHATTSTNKAKATPPLADFDPRKAKKISTGRVHIDARLDLHGMRQDDAHSRLRAFVFDAHARGLKTVLIITGKGRDVDDITLSYVDTLDRTPRGVLRRNLPRWLAEPDLRALVVSYTQAAQHHGGDGAFYVELRRHRG